jgi:hypothetical protein
MEAITGGFKPARPEDVWAMKRDDSLDNLMVLFLSLN